MNAFGCLVVVGILFLSAPSCKSKKNCATFENPEKEFHVKYNKGGLVKKRKGSRKPSWEGK